MIAYGKYITTNQIIQPVPQTHHLDSTKNQHLLFTVPHRSSKKNTMSLGIASTATQNYQHPIANTTPQHPTIHPPTHPSSTTTKWKRNNLSKKSLKTKRHQSDTRNPKANSTLHPTNTKNTNPTIPTKIIPNHMATVLYSPNTTNIAPPIIQCSKKIDPTANIEPSFTEERKTYFSWSFLFTLFEYFDLRNWWIDRM